MAICCPSGLVGRVTETVAAETVGFSADGGNGVVAVATAHGVGGGSEFLVGRGSTVASFAGVGRVVAVPMGPAV